MTPQLRTARALLDIQTLLDDARRGTISISEPEHTQLHGAVESLRGLLSPNRTNTT